MKVVRAKGRAFSITVPVKGLGRGHIAQFVDHLATLPDDVADTLVAMMPSFYQVDRHIIPSGGEKALIVRDMGWGDVLLATPTARAVHERTGVPVGFATYRRYIPLLDGNPHIGEVHCLEDMESGSSYQAVSKNYDAVIDLRKYVEHREMTGTHMNRAAAFARAADITLPQSEWRIDYYVKPEEIGPATKRVGRSGGEKVVGFVLRTSTGNRSWPHEHSLGVISELMSRGWRVVVLDHENQGFHGLEANAQLVNLCGRCSMRETAAVMSVCDVILTPDTGLFHQASALNKPVATYFGPFPVAERATHDKVVEAHNRQVCQPCRQYHCLNKDERGCSRCIALSPQQAADLVDGTYRRFYQ